MLKFRVVFPSLTKNNIYTAYSRLINLIIWSQWCKERFIVHFTIQ